MNIQNFNQLLTDFKKIDLSPLKEKTIFLEMIGKHHLEDVSSRILAFYLDTTKEHNLGDTCLQALLSCARKNQDDKLITLSVKREVSTVNHNNKKQSQYKSETNGRIDLLIETHSAVIIIENKINHHTNNNPFKTYIEYTKNNEQYKNKDHIFILLVKDKPNKSNRIPENFIVVSHFEWTQKVKTYLPNVWQNADNKYLVFLMDYISAIENLNPKKERNIMDKQLLKLFQEHHQTLIDLENQKDTICKIYADELQEFIEQIDQKTIDAFHNQQPKSNDSNYKFLGAYIHSRHYQYTPKKNEECEISFWLGWNLSCFILGICLEKSYNRSNKYKTMQEILNKKEIKYECNDDAEEIYLIYQEKVDDIPPFKDKVIKTIADIIKKLDLK